MGRHDLLTPDLTWVCSCGKVGFLTRKAARRARNNTHTGKALHTYRCATGSGWHLTSERASSVTYHRDRIS